MSQVPLHLLICFVSQCSTPNHSSARTAPFMPVFASRFCSSSYHVPETFLSRSAQVLLFKIVGNFKGKIVCFGVPLLTQPSQSIASVRTHTPKNSTVRSKLHTQHVKPRVRSLFFRNTTKRILHLSQFVHGRAQAIRWRSHSTGASAGISHHESHVY